MCISCVLHTHMRVLFGGMEGWTPTQPKWKRSSSNRTSSSEDSQLKGLFSLHKQQLKSMGKHRYTRFVTIRPHAGLTGGGVSIKNKG